MTKWGGFPSRAGRHRITDCHLRIVDDDTINEPCHQWSALDKRPRVQSRLPALTQRLNVLGQGCHMDVLLCLGIALPQLRHSALLVLRSLLSSALACLTLDDLCQGYIEQPSLLAFELRQDSTQRLTSRVQGLGRSGAQRRPCQFIREEGRRLQDTT